MPRRIIRIAAAVIERPGGEIVLVRKRGSAIFMQPGGKTEPGETPLAALLRELHEELGLMVEARDVTALGQFSAVAANEADSDVVADAFWLRSDAPVRIAAEIEEAMWVQPHALPDIAIAPLSRNHILPAFRAQVVSGRLA